ncbi:hypothetical protein QQ045_016417 [Rhodiola kirilowii]
MFTSIWKNVGDFCTFITKQQIIRFDQQHSELQSSKMFPGLSSFQPIFIKRHNFIRTPLATAAILPNSAKSFPSKKKQAEEKSALVVAWRVIDTLSTLNTTLDTKSAGSTCLRCIAPRAIFDGAVMYPGILSYAFRFNYYEYCDSR